MPALAEKAALRWSGSLLPVMLMIRPQRFSIIFGNKRVRQLTRAGEVQGHRLDPTFALLHRPAAAAATGVVHQNVDMPTAA